MLMLREARRQDAGAMARIHADCWREVYSFMPPAVLDNRNRHYRLRQWLEWFNEPAPDDGLFVFVAADRVVGFCFARRNDDPDMPAEGEMHAAYVLPDWRGGQVGCTIMSTLGRHLMSRGLSSAGLWAFDQNPMRRWYAQLGWKRIVRRDRELAGHQVPESGYIFRDLEALVEKVERLTDGSLPVIADWQNQSRWPDLRRGLPPAGGR